MAAPDLSCINISKRFGSTIAVDDVSFEVPAGSFFSILGPSGCGKTTIMRMIAGFLEPSAGDIQIKGRTVLDIAPNKRPVNMVFQHLALFPMMNVSDNIGYGLRRQGFAKSEISRKVDEVLERIQLPGIGKRAIPELSGGQKQRVAIARCMVLQPDVLLLDEPLGALDLKLRDQMKIELKTLQAEFDTTFVYITHDQSEALLMSDAVAVMNGGKFEQIAPPQELYYRPETSFVAGFVGNTNRWSGTVTRSDGYHVETRAEGADCVRGVSLTRDLATNSKVEVFVRPESIRVGFNAGDVSSFENTLSGTVERILFNGGDSRILIKADERSAPIEATLPQSGEYSRLRSGDKVVLGWADVNCNIFTAGAAT